MAARAIEGVRELSSHKGGWMPDAYGAFVVQLDRSEYEVEAEPQPVKVHAIAARTVDKRWPQPHSREYRSSQAAPLFLAELQIRLKRCRSLWLICDGLLEAMTALGWWQSVADGEWIIGGSDSGRESSIKDWRGLLVIDDPPSVVQLRSRRGGGLLTLLDSRNWGFREAAPGKDGEIPGPAEAAARLFDWWAGWIKVVREEELGSLATGAASQAWRAFRRRFNAAGVRLHRDQEVLDLERAAHFGGRVEAHFLGRVQRDDTLTAVNRAGKKSDPLLLVPGPIEQYDANALYTWIASCCLMPTQPATYAVNPRQDCLDKRPPHSYAIADVTITTDRPIYPAVDPADDGGRTYWPIGTFRTTLHDPELKIAIAEAHLDQIHRIAWYTAGVCLAPFADWALDRLRTAEGAARAPYKLLSNALYGRFGASGRHWVDAAPEETKAMVASWQRWDDDARRLVKYRKLWDRHQVESEAGESHESIPAIAGAITAYARVYLAGVIRDAGYRNVLYCSTDSVIVTPAGADRLKANARISPNLPGALRLVRTADSCEIRGINRYKMDGVEIAAGVPAGAANLQNGQWLDWHVETINDSMPQKKLPLPVESFRRYSLPSGYWRGLVGADGFVYPRRAES